MDEKTLLGKIIGKPVPTLDEQGNQIPDLEGLYFRPLHAQDSLDIIDLTKVYGKQFGYCFYFARSVVDENGNQVISDKSAPKLAKAKSAVIMSALPVIRSISGNGVMETAVAADGQKKTSGKKTRK